MESMAVAPGFARAIAGTGPVFAAFLVPHILAGLTEISSGALVMVSRKGTERHVRAGTATSGRSRCWPPPASRAPTPPRWPCPC